MKQKDIKLAKVPQTTGQRGRGASSYIWRSKVVLRHCKNLLGPEKSFQAIRYICVVNEAIQVKLYKAHNLVIFTSALWYPYIW